MDILAGFVTDVRLFFSRPVSPSFSPAHFWRAIRFHHYRASAQPTPRHIRGRNIVRRRSKAERDAKVKLDPF
jgi:hypothetical protein